MKPSQKKEDRFKTIIVEGLWSFRAEKAPLLVLNFGPVTETNIFHNFSIISGSSIKSHSCKETGHFGFAFAQSKVTMKTKTAFTKCVLFLSLLTSLVGCGSNSSSNGSGTVAATSSYYLSNGYCYSNTGQIVSTTYCSSNGYTLSNGSCYASSGQIVSTSYCTSSISSTTGFYLSGGSCYSSATNQIVASAYCSSTTTTGSSSQCVGYYYYVSSYGSQAVYCNGTNCRGYMLYNSYGQAVTCY